jgi:hypothetical protein
MSGGSGALGGATRWAFYPGNVVDTQSTRVKCDYCGVFSLGLKSNCGSCGAGLPGEATEVPGLFYNPEAIDYQDLAYLMRPGQSIPIKRSFLHDLVSGAMMMFPRR